MTEAAKLTLSGQDHDYPVLSGSVGPDVVDIRKLYGQTGAFTYDPGFTSTASCQSKLTYIDGDEGVLLHRGYPIGELAEQSSFMEVCYLLLNGELPTADELEKFSWTISRHTMVHEQLAQFFRGFRYDSRRQHRRAGDEFVCSADIRNIRDTHRNNHRLVVHQRQAERFLQARD